MPTNPSVPLRVPVDGSHQGEPVDADSLPAMLGMYRVVRRIATGGMGEILLGHDDGLDRPVAIKRIRPGAHLDPERRERFRREARAIARLDHPAVVRVYDLVHDDDLECLVMEYVEGRDLRQILRGGPLAVDVALSLAVEICDGLGLAHDHGIVHRDLKSENILVTADGRAKITDFGIAKRLLSGDDGLTGPDVVLGTCRAIAPEQAMGQPLDGRADLFSLGVLLYEMTTGVSPFESRSDLATLQRVATERQRPAAELAPDLPREVSDLIDELLSKTADDRPRCAEDVVDRLALIASDRDIDLGTRGVASHVRSLSRRRSFGERLADAGQSLTDGFRRLFRSESSGEVAPPAGP